VDARRVLTASAWGTAIGAVCGLIGIVLAVHIVELRVA